MAAGAGVRRAGPGGEVGPRHLEAVIVARVDHHVGLGRHVAVDALAAGLARRVVVVLGHVERARAGGTGRRRALPSARSFRLCGSWQSEQVTPAAYILLCRNEPWMNTSPSIWPSAW